MALTGRFNLRKTFTGRIILQVEEEVVSFWGRLIGKNKMHRRWRDANMMDLAAPELRTLVDMRFRPLYRPPTHEPAQDPPKTSAPRQAEASPAPVLHYEPYQEDGGISKH